MIACHVKRAPRNSQRSRTSTCSPHFGVGRAARTAAPGGSGCAMTFESALPYALQLCHDRNSYDTMELYFGCTCKITVHGTCTAKIIADRQNTITREVERTNSRYSTLHPPPGPRARRDATLGSRGVRWAAGAGPRKAAPRYIFGRSQTRCTLGGATPRGDLGSVYHSFSLGETLP